MAGELSTSTAGPVSGRTKVNDIIGPTESNVLTVQVTGSGTQTLDLAAWAGRWVQLVTTMEAAIFLRTSGSSSAPDGTATTGATRAPTLPAGYHPPFIVPALETTLAITGSAAGYASVYLAEG